MFSLEKLKLKRCINESNKAARELDMAIKLEETVRESLQSASTNMNEAIGGQAAQNIYNNIQSLISDSNSTSSGLISTLNKIKQANSEYENDYNNCEDK